MRIFSNMKKSLAASRSRQAFRSGSYSLLMIAVVLAVVLLVNLFAGLLPATLTHWDISASRLYSVSSNTKSVINRLEDDVSIYWIVQADKEDAVLENLLEKYESLSSHIQVTKKNPDLYPTFSQQYTQDEVENNSLVVECGDRSRYIARSDIYLSEPDLTGQGKGSSFDGEGAITSAIDYVINEDQPIVYRLEGHGEPDLPAGLADQIEKSNMTVQSLSLLKEDTVPEDADALLIYAPQTDFSSEEVRMLQDYTAQGGRLLVAAGPSEESDLSTLNGFLKDYGIKPVPGIVVEPAREHYAFRQPHALLPAMNESPLTDPLVEEHYLPVFPISQGMKIGETPEGTEVTSLLTTSRDSYSKAAGFALETYEKEDGDAAGPFSLGVQIQCPGDGEIIWFSSSVFLEDAYNAYSSGANLDLGMNALAELVGESDAMAIRTKPLGYDYLTISESTAAALKALLVGIVPLGYLGIGLIVVYRRRRRCAARA